MKRTVPSAMPTFTPPGCLLRAAVVIARIDAAPGTGRVPLAGIVAVALALKQVGRRAIGTDIALERGPFEPPRKTTEIKSLAHDHL